MDFDFDPVTQKCSNWFIVLPFEIVVLIFRSVGYKIPLKVSTEWDAIFTDINVLIDIFPPVRNCYQWGVQHSISLLKSTKVPPSVDTVQRLVWSYQSTQTKWSYDTHKFIPNQTIIQTHSAWKDIFLATFNRFIWENIKLLPTVDDIRDDTYSFEYDKISHKFFRSQFFIECLSRDKNLTEHVRNLFVKHEYINSDDVMSPCFIHWDCFASWNQNKLVINNDSMIWCLQQPWFPICPAVLGFFAESGLSLIPLIDAALKPMFYDQGNLDGYSLTTVDSPYQLDYVFRKILDGIVEMFNFDNRHSITKEKIETFEYCYRSCTNVNDIFLSVLKNLPQIRNDQRLSPVIESVVIHLNSFQNLLSRSKDVHPLESICVNNVYRKLLNLTRRTGKNGKPLFNVILNDISFKFVRDRRKNI